MDKRATILGGVGCGVGIAISEALSHPDQFHQSASHTALLLSVDLACGIVGALSVELGWKFLSRRKQAGEDHSNAVQ